ncbi:CU044_5270 family protein [Nonomuraea sp. B12E4]|uniref:CU044_5270 family protein n=1 Tax=Nonomuraea sp. B12E4 TaxID=3153564 RepID=UPI00325D69D7
MDEDEIRAFAEGRPAVPPYGAEARARARERLLEQARGAGRFRLPRFGWQAAAAFGVTVALVGGAAVTLSGRGPDGVTPATSATQAAAGAPDDLDPRPGQFILVESDVMYPLFRIGRSGVDSRELTREHRKVWQSVDGSADGLLLVEGRASRPWPDESLPEAAAKEQRGSAYIALPACPGDQYRPDYASLSTLPSEAAAMRAYVYRASAAQVSKAQGKRVVGTDEAAWAHVKGLLEDTYLPRAQREALFEATKTIPGVEVTEGVADGADREGVALGRPDVGGKLTQLIFDPTTRQYMGLRSTVTDAGQANAPVGSVVNLTAQYDASVVDELPDVKTRPMNGGTCHTPSRPPSDEAFPMEAPSDEAFPTDALSEDGFSMEAPSDEAFPTDALSEDGFPMEAPSEDSVPVEPPGEAYPVITRTVTASPEPPPAGD